MIYFFLVYVWTCRQDTCCFWWWPLFLKRCHSGTFLSIFMHIFIFLFLLFWTRKFIYLSFNTLFEVMICMFCISHRLLIVAFIRRGGEASGGWLGCGVWLMIFYIGDFIFMIHCLCAKIFWSFFQLRVSLTLILLHQLSF